MNKYVSAFAVSGALCCAALTSADDHGVVANLSVAKVEVRADGLQVLESARNTRPGDILEYRVTYRNTRYEPARGVVSTLSVPVNRLSYVPNSALPGILEASVDGKTFAPVPLMHLVVRDDGHAEMEAVPASEYRILRWQLGDLPGRSSVTVSARMHIDEVPVVLVTNSAR